MRRRDLLLSTFAGLLTTVAPVGLLTDAGRAFRDVGAYLLSDGTAFMFGVDYGIPGPAVILLQSRDDGRTWEMVGEVALNDHDEGR